MHIGYVRVSKSDGTQTLDPQLDALIASGVAPDRIYKDLASGRRDDRPGLRDCLKSLQPGNTLVVWKLDRLGRDLKHLVNTVADLQQRGIGLKVLAGAGAQIDTTTANGRLFFGIFAALAEFERELIAERTRAGLAAARARGRQGGRPRKMDRGMLVMAMTAMSDPKANAAEAARVVALPAEPNECSTKYEAPAASATGANMEPAFPSGRWQRVISTTTICHSDGVAVWTMPAGTSAAALRRHWFLLLPPAELDRPDASAHQPATVRRPAAGARSH